MRRKGVAIGVAVVLLAGAGGAAAWWRHTEQQHEQERAADRAARSVVDSLAAGWSHRDVTEVPFTQGTAADEFTQTFAGLGNAATPTLAVKGFLRTGDAASATLDVVWQLAGPNRWAYTVPVSAAYDGQAWRITPPAEGSAWVAGIKADDTVKLMKTQGQRGDLLDDAGKPLMPIGDVYPVQLDPTRATPAVAAALEQVVDEAPGVLVAKLAAATKTGSKAPIPVISYRQADFDRRVARLDALKGVIYPRTTQPLAKTRTFGQPLLGSYGEVSAEMIEQGQGRYAIGDRAGRSGLQGQYDQTLAGTPGLQVVSSTGKVLFEQKAVDGRDVQTSLRPGVQDAAEKAIAFTQKVPSALVAVDIPTGKVVAVANNPTDGFDRALTGTYPPGSTLKIATAYALLSRGKVTPQTRVTCPKTVTIDGRQFRNFEGESLGTPTMTENFEHSCNTAFIQMAQRLDGNDLAATAKTLGIGAGWAARLRVKDAQDGSVPVANGRTDQAAAAIGQGRTLASPVAMAGLVANIARGSVVAPTLVQTGTTKQAPVPLDAKAVGEVRAMMRSVVTGGTGRTLQGAAGGAVSGKTGTAEYGPANPPRNRVWFVGYQGRLAFAVLVEDGRSGGTVAAPIAKRFLDYLAAG